ncbi:lysophospholipid acyltransferase family protein [Streptomyces sp. NPDC048650]|uniref:lysophospholipid acyltransferase family protein n=1 Tax=unclassified Streptomyces TaxID=2593676 RepID=UPI0037203F82
MPRLGQTPKRDEGTWRSLFFGAGKHTCTSRKGRKGEIFLERVPPLYGATRALFGLYGATFCPLVVEGAHHLPSAGPAILAPNHLAATDGFFLMAAAQRRLFFLAKQESFASTSLAGRIRGNYLKRIGCLPTERGGGPDAIRSILRRASRVLAGKRVLVIFPEGTFSLDGNVHRGRSGAAHLALTSQVPLIPVGITSSCRHRDVGVHRCPRSIRIRFGPAVDASSFSSGNAVRPAALELRALTRHLMVSIADLSGQTYVDTFAPTASIPAPPPAAVDRPTC